jgi:hypothetical protein
VKDRLNFETLKRLAAICLMVGFAMPRTAEAAPTRLTLRCEAAFSNTVTGLNETTATLAELLAHMRTTQPKDSELRQAARLAMKLLSASGATARLIEYKGSLAVEIVPIARSSNGWNRMAASLQKNYGTRLIYSPLELSALQVKSAYDSADRAILISTESLREGRAERNLLHEVGHMKSDTTRIDSPNVFSGFIQVTDSETRTHIVENNLHYAGFQEMDEIPQMARDFDRLGRLIQRIDLQELRSQLVDVALRGRDILANANAALLHARKIRKDMKATIESGPLMLEDGSLAENRAYIAAGPQTLVIVERFDNGTVRMRLEDDALTTELWFKGDASWISLIEGLQNGTPEALEQFQKIFPDLVQNWENDLKPSLAALRISSEAIIANGVHAPAQELANWALSPRQVLSPKLRRASK